MKKYLQIALFSAVIIIMAVSICGAVADRQDLNSALVLLNHNPYEKIEVLQPASVWLPGVIIGGSWKDKPFELYLYTTANTFQKYLAYDDSAKQFLWKPYTDLKKITPLFAAAGLPLPDYYLFEWPIVEDSSIMPQGDLTLNLCIDTKQDNAFDLLNAACGQTTINVKGCTPTLKISPTSINSTYTQGESMQTEQITVSDNCTNTYTLKESTGAVWLTVTPAGLVTFTSGLTAKTYNTNIDILNAKGVKSGTVPVQLTIKPGQQCTSGQGTPNPLVLYGGFDGSASGDIKFTNSCGNADISAVSISANTSWLTLKSTTGNTVSVTASSTGLASGYQFQGSITATIKNTNEKVTVPVNFTSFVPGGNTTGGNTTGGNTTGGNTTGGNTTGGNNLAFCLPWDTSCSNNASTTCTGHAWPSNFNVNKSDTVSTAIFDCNGAAITQYSVSVNRNWLTVTQQSNALSIVINISGVTPGTSDTATITITPTNTNVPAFTVQVVATAAVQCTTDTSVKFVKSQLDMQQITKSVTVNASALVQDSVSVVTDCTKQVAKNYSFVVGDTSSSTNIPDWITVAHTDGSETMTITYNNDKINTKAIGTYNAWIRVQYGTYTEIVLQVTLNITAVHVDPPAGVRTLTSGTEYIRNNQTSLTADYYQGQVPPPGGLVSFVSATKDWVSRRDMIVMHGGADCTESVPTLKEYYTILYYTKQPIPSNLVTEFGTDKYSVTTSNASGFLNISNMSGVMINNRKFYWDFSNPMNQGVSIWTNGEQKGPAGCYYAMIYNTNETHYADSSMLFTTRP